MGHLSSKGECEEEPDQAAPSLTWPDQVAPSLTWQPRSERLVVAVAPLPAPLPPPCGHDHAAPAGQSRALTSTNQQKKERLAGDIIFTRGVPALPRLLPARVGCGHAAAESSWPRAATCPLPPAWPGGLPPWATGRLASTCSTINGRWRSWIGCCSFARQMSASNAFFEMAQASYRACRPKTDVFVNSDFHSQPISFAPLEVPDLILPRRQDRNLTAEVPPEVPRLF